MDSPGPSVLSLIVLRVGIESIRQVFVGFGRHAEQGFLGVVLTVSSLFTSQTTMKCTWLVYSGDHLPVEGQVE
jgi:hypothetical protein